MSAKDVVGLIYVDVGDTNVDCGFETLIRAGIKHVIVVDAHRLAKDYATQKYIAAKRITARYVRNRSDVNAMLATGAFAATTDVLEVPPLFYCRAEDLVEVMRGNRPDWARTAALAPRYYTPMDHLAWATLTLLTHMMWSFFSLLSRGRSYRGTFAVLRAITREGGKARMAEDRESTWRKEEMATFYALPDTRPITHILYTLRRETISWR
jgi:hypothetical protein